MVLLITGIACAAGGAPAEGFAGTSVFQPEGRAAVAVVVLHGSEGGSAPYAPWLTTDGGYDAAPSHRPARLLH